MVAQIIKPDLVPGIKSVDKLRKLPPCVVDHGARIKNDQDGQPYKEHEEGKNQQAVLVVENLSEEANLEIKLCKKITEGDEARKEHGEIYERMGNNASTECEAAISYIMR